MFSTLLPQLERELLWRASGNEKNKFMKFWWSSEPGGGIGKVASKSFLLTLFFRDLTDSHWQIFHSLWKMGLELSRVNLGFISKSQLSNICRADWVKGLTSSPGWTLFKTSWCVGAGAESVDSVVRITGKEEEEFNPILPLIFSRGPCRQLFLEGLRFVVFLTSAVSYHPLPGKRTQAHCCCWTTQQTGARDAKYQLTFACCWLLGLVSPPALFFFFFFPLLTAAWKRTPAFLWSSGENSWLQSWVSQSGLQASKALASFQAQDLWDVGIFHWGYSAASSNVKRDAFWEWLLLIITPKGERGKKKHVLSYRGCSQALQKAGDWDQPLDSCPGITGHRCAYNVLGLVCPAKRAAVASISTGQRVKCLTAQKSEIFLLICF